jgi:hypothetical protein
MNVNKIIEVLKEHVDKEVEIHKKVFKGSHKSVSQLVKMHLKDNLRIHKDFWQKLKKSIKEK